MKINVDARMREAVTVAVHGAIVAVGGIPGIRRMAMFQSSEKAEPTKLAA